MLHHEEGGLGKGRPVETPARLLPPRVHREEQLAQVESQLTPQDLRGAVDLGPEDLLLPVRDAAPVALLRGLTPKQEHEPARRAVDHAVPDAAGLVTGQGAKRLRAVAGHHHTTVAHSPPAHLQRVGHVGQRRCRLCGRWPASAAATWSSAAGLRAESARSCASRSAASGARLRRLLQDDVGVGAADAEGAHRRRAAGAARRPRERVG